MDTTNIKEELNTLNVNNLGRIQEKEINKITADILAADYATC
jgi:hypothetical protein